MLNNELYIFSFLQKKYIGKIIIRFIKYLDLLLGSHYIIVLFFSTHLALIPLHLLQY